MHIVRSEEFAISVVLGLYKLWPTAAFEARSGKAEISNMENRSKSDSSNERDEFILVIFFERRWHLVCKWYVSLLRREIVFFFIVRKSR